MIRLDDVSHRYEIGAEKIHALKQVTLHVAPGEQVAVVGPSGCGKSTLFHIVGGMMTAWQGKVQIDGKQLQHLNDHERSDVRNQTIGFVFQLFHLLPYYTAAQNVELPLVIHGVDPKERRQRAHEVLDLVGLADRIDHKPFQLSGGEMQRVSIARAMINRPKLLLADEPTGNLDRKASDAVTQLLLEMSREQGMTLLVTTHQETVMKQFPRKIHLDKGEVVDETRR